MWLKLNIVFHVKFNIGVDMMGAAIPKLSKLPRQSSTINLLARFELDLGFVQLRDLHAPSRCHLPLLFKYVFQTYFVSRSSNHNFTY